MTLDTLFSIGTSSASAIVVFFGLFKFLGEAWIENKFSEKLNLLKHQHALEIKHLQVKIDSMLGGALKTQDREFEYLPQAWQKLCEVHELVQSLVTNLNIYPRIETYSLHQLDEFLKRSDFEESEKESLRISKDRNKLYSEILYFNLLAKTKKSILELKSMIFRNGIYFPNTIKKNFILISEILWEATNTNQAGYEFSDHKLKLQSLEKIENQSMPLYKEIENEIYSHLQSYAKNLNVLNLN